MNYVYSRDIMCMKKFLYNKENIFYEPKIKEALSCEIKKDEETERICNFIADFIKDYGYILSYGNAVRIECTFLYPGKYGRKRIKYNTIILQHPLDKNISRSIITTFNKNVVRKLLEKEKAHFTYTHYTYYCTDTWEIEFHKV